MTSMRAQRFVCVPALRVYAGVKWEFGTPWHSR